MVPRGARGRWRRERRRRARRRCVCAHYLSCIWCTTAALTLRSASVHPKWTEHRLPAGGALERPGARTDPHGAPVPGPVHHQPGGCQGPGWAQARRLGGVTRQFPAPFSVRSHRLGSVWQGAHQGSPHLPKYPTLLHTHPLTSPPRTTHHSSIHLPAHMRAHPSHPHISRSPLTHPHLHCRCSRRTRA